MAILSISNFCFQENETENLTRNEFVETRNCISIQKSIPTSPSYQQPSSTMDQSPIKLCLLPHLDQSAESPIPTGSLPSKKKLLCKRDWFRADLEDLGTAVTSECSTSRWTCSHGDERVSFLKDLGQCPNRQQGMECVCGFLVKDTGAQRKARQMYCQICSDYGHKAGNLLLASMIFLPGEPLDDHPYGFTNRNKHFQFKVAVPEMDHPFHCNIVRTFYVCRRQFQYLFGLTDYRLGQLTKLAQSEREEQSYRWIGSNYRFEMEWSRMRGPFRGTWLGRQSIPNPAYGMEIAPTMDPYWPREIDTYHLHDISLYAGCSKRDADVARLPDLKPCSKRRVAGVCLCWDLTHNPVVQRRARQMYVDICSAYGHAAGNRLLASMIVLKDSSSAKQPHSRYLVPIPEKNWFAYLRAYQVCRGQFMALFGLEKSRLSRLTFLSRNRPDGPFPSWNGDLSRYYFECDSQCRSSYSSTNYIWHSKPTLVGKKTT